MTTKDENRDRAASARLAVNETRPAKASHIEITDPARCVACEKPCAVACPAHTYSWSDGQGKMVINFENCLECGSCRAICPYAVIDWKNPLGGFGVCYRYG